MTTSTSMFPRLFLLTHSLYYIVVGGGMLTIPHEVSEFFYPDGMQPLEEAASGTPSSEIANVNVRAYGLALLSWHVLILGLVYLNEPNLYAWAITSLAPFDIAMLAFVIMEENSFLIILHSLALLAMFATSLLLTPIFETFKQRVGQTLGRSVTEPVGGSSSISAQERGAAGAKTPQSLHTRVVSVGGGDFGRIR